MLNADWLVQVYAHDKDGDPCIGTGYSIGNGLVLTARHVVLFDKRADNPQLKLVWPEQDKHEIPFADTDIVFDGFACEPNIDIAVIRYPQATPFKPPLIDWLLTAPALTTAWASRGFPRAGKELTTRDDLGVPGKVAGLKRHEVELTTEVDATEANGWAGFSGAPVFIGHQLAAVITHDYLTMTGYFKAVSIPYLLADKALGFRQAIGLDDDAIALQQFLDGQKQQIVELLSDMQRGKLFQALAAKLPIPPPNITPDSVNEKLFAQFDKDCLALFDLLLQTSSSVLKQDASTETLENVRTLFCLFASLMASGSLVARQSYIKLSVWTKMASELHLAPLYGTNPNFTTTEDGELKGRYSMDASVFTRETGWEHAELKKEATKIVFKGVYGKDAAKVLNSFELKKLNATIRQRQNRALNQLHRFELNCSDEALANNPLSNPLCCEVLNAGDCLLDLPIVHYGDAEATLEAELSAKMDELFEILQLYGYSA